MNRLLRCNLLSRNIGTRRGRVKRKIQRINAHETWLLLLLLLGEKKGCMRKLAEKKENHRLLGNPELKEQRELLIFFFFFPVLGSFPAKQASSVFSDLLTSPGLLPEVDEMPSRWHPFNTVLISLHIFFS